LFVPVHDPVDAVFGDEALECLAEGGAVEVSLAMWASWSRSSVSSCIVIVAMASTIAITMA
jgi:hypothetical protein